MSEIQYRVVEAFPEPSYAELARQAFSDYEQSPLLSDALAEEAANRKWQPAGDQGSIRIGAFASGELIGWSYARAEGSLLQMVNSGVAPTSRRQGVYSGMAQLVLKYAKAQGHIAVVSRHTTNNNAVVIAKLKLGFFVSGFEYSEVYGPLVLLSYIPGAARQRLHRARSMPIRRHEP